MDEINDAQLLDMFTDTGDVSHFNMLVMRHIKKVRTKDFLRSKKRYPVEYTDDVSEVAADDSNSPAGLLMAQEFDSKIGKALESLSPPLRAAIVLTVVQGMNMSEAAQAENCLVATMYWRVHHARKILESKLIGDAS